MSISDLFDSEFKSRNKGHFSAIVRVATADGDLSKEEKEFLDKLAVRLEISPAEYEEILENPLKYPINPPYLHVQRLERLYDLSDPYKIPVCAQCGSMPSSTTYCSVCDQSDIKTVPIPYAAKLLFQELNAMGIRTNLFPKA